MTYKFFIKSDLSKEAVGINEFGNLEEAQKGFASMKQLSLESFNKIFKVERHGTDRP